MSAFGVAMPLPSVANLREHWSKRSRRAKHHRLVGLAAGRQLSARLDGHHDVVAVTITRIAPRALDDDNLASACKALRDGIADALGVRDNDPRVAWRYAQERGKPAAVRIEIERPLIASRS